MLFKNKLSKEDASKKIRHYCSYQERCHSEVRDKLYSFGLRKNEVEEVISELIENNFLNEERFAIQFAGGKFRMKQWGRKKIQYALQQKGVNHFIIKSALYQLEQGDYYTTLQKLAETKWRSLSRENVFVRESKTNNYLLQKGFEQKFISEVLKKIKMSAIT